MNFLLSFVVHTSNILGIFYDPFEFAGDYGPGMNPIRDKVFEKIVYKKDDRGPLLSEIVTPEMIRELEKIQKQYPSFSKNDFDYLIQFINKYHDQSIFLLTRKCPSSFLSLEKKLNDESARQGKIFDLPILSSSGEIQGNNLENLKKNLLNQLYTENTFRLTKRADELKKTIEECDPFFLKNLWGPIAENKDLHAFISPAGQIFFYWLYHSMNFHLVIDNEETIKDINRAKLLFIQTLGNSKRRATHFLEKFRLAQSSVVFTQECDNIFPKVLAKDFHPIDLQNPSDGCFIFLKKDLWNKNYEMVPITEYSDYEEGKINIIFAKTLQGEEFLLASCHGNSTKAEDGRLQIQLIMKKFEELRSFYPDLPLVIGIDANTKNPEDVQKLRILLKELGLIASNVGPTTVKQRMVTVQWSKSQRYAIDEEDYIITLTPQKGGKYNLTHQTVGFQEQKADPKIVLPNIYNPSDHYPVGCQLTEIDGG